MTKREYVFKVLDKVKWHWNKEQEVREYLTANDDQNYINYLYDEFVKAVDITLKSQANDKGLALMETLNQIKIKENVSKQAEQADLMRLEQLIASL